MSERVKKENRKTEDRKPENKKTAFPKPGNFLYPVPPVMVSCGAE